MEVILLSTEELIFQGKAESVIFPGENGVFESLSYHRPLVSRLIKGNVIVDGRMYPIQRGLVGINNNKATIVVEK
jgi:F0F1-type ATP synthase epsilon subunit